MKQNFDNCSGDELDIYEDPVTKTKLEGKAKLIKPIAIMADNLERWLVEFIGEPSSYYERTI